MKSHARGPFKLLGVITLFLGLVGCFDLGVQGGDVPKKFDGIETAVALSPTSIRLGWTTDKRFTKYLVYLASNNSAIKEETFQTTVINSLSPATSYYFSVTAVDASGAEEGVGGFSPVSTLATFAGVRAADLSQPGPVAVNLVWHKESDLIQYDIYTRKGSDSWAFTTPAASVTAANHYEFTGLDEGTLYCFYVVAKYADGTSEPAMTSIAANANAPCVTTSSDLTGLPVVALNPVVPGGFPWFVSRAGQPDMKIDVYDKTSNSLIATRTGNGPFRAVSTQTAGVHEYYGLVSQTVSGVVKKAKIDLEIKDAAGNSKTKARLRSLRSSDAAIPRLVSNGQGVQRLGGQVTKGDFNCDGIPDLAIAAPKATPYVHPNHVSEMGAVIVYYGESYIPSGTTSVLYRLRTSVAPSTSAAAPNAQLIYYPTDTSQFRFGTTLAKGNFNGDCKKLNPADPAHSETGPCESLFAQYAASANPSRVSDMKLIYSCDDLAIGIEPTFTMTTPASGGVFVIYGDPNSGLISGSGGTNFGINEATCDPISATCRAARFSHHLTTVYHFGKALGTGDVNNDGFDDLIVSGTTSSSPNFYGRVTVLSGSAQGVQPTTYTYANAEIQAEAATVYGPSDAIAMISRDQGLQTTAGNFGWSVAGVPNSRTCVNLSAAPIIPFRSSTLPVDSGFDFSKCADVAIGDPSRATNRGSVVTCRANFSATTSQPRTQQHKVTSWSCLEHYPSGLESGARYGFSLLGVLNQNGYPYLSLPPSTAADVTGALFVGAPWASVPDQATASPSGRNSGKVFGYYATPAMKNLNGIQGVMGSGAHTVQSSMGVPCNRQNENVSGNRCENQMIYNSSPQANEHFGYAIGSGNAILLDTPELPSLLISAPHRDIPGLNGTVVDGGSVFVYKGDLSVLGANAQTRVDFGGCVGSDCYYFSGGVNPFGPTLLYNQSSTASAQFGLSAAAGDNFSGDTSPAETDIVAAAPDISIPVEGNGGVFLYRANSGFPSTQTIPDELITTNISKEINYRFEQAKVVGDLNGDGYADVISRIRVAAGRVETVVFYGGVNGLILTPTPSLSPIGLGPKIVASSLDSQLGQNFFPAGDINGDGLMDVFFTGTQASYIYYGSLTGLVSNTEPTITPVGKNPLKFAISTIPDVITFDRLMGDNTQTPPSYDVSNQAVAAGDFNGDGFGDLAIGIDKAHELPSGVDTSGLGNAYSPANNGRVVIIYGSAKGPQVGSGGFIRLLVSSGSTAQADVVAQAPCSPDPSDTSKQKCFVQLIGPSTIAPNKFGFALAAVKSMEGSNPAWGLMIGDPEANANDGEVHYLRGSATGLNPSPTSLQVIPAPNLGGGNKFGYLVSRAGDINGDLLDDIVISAPTVTANGSNMPGLYVFYGLNVAGTGQFAGVATFSSSPPVLNAIHAAAADRNPQWIIPANLTTNTTAQFGYGLSGIGDFNGDGYQDVMVNVARGDFELDVLKPEAGYTIIYFGSRYGLRSNMSPSMNPRCYGFGTTDEICEPMISYLPDGTSYENTYVSNSAAGDINGDGLYDVIIGGFGRNHPSGLAFSSGVFYVLY